MEYGVSHWNSLTAPLLKQAQVLEKPAEDSAGEIIA